MGRGAEIVATGGAQTLLEAFGAATMWADEPADWSNGEDGGGEGVRELDFEMRNPEAEIKKWVPSAGRGLCVVSPIQRTWGWIYSSIAQRDSALTGPYSVFQAVHAAVGHFNGETKCFVRPPIASHPEDASSDAQQERESR
jgi:hypothetical protein